MGGAFALRGLKTYGLIAAILELVAEARVNEERSIGMTRLSWTQENACLWEVGEMAHD